MQREPSLIVPGRSLSFIAYPWCQASSLGRGAVLPRLGAFGSHDASPVMPGGSPHSSSIPYRAAMLGRPMGARASGDREGEADRPPPFLVSVFRSPIKPDPSSPSRERAVRGGFREIKRSRHPLRARRSPLTKIRSAKKPEPGASHSRKPPRTALGVIAHPATDGPNLVGRRKRNVLFEGSAKVADSTLLVGTEGHHRLA